MQLAKQLLLDDDLNGMRVSDEHATALVALFKAQMQVIVGGGGEHEVAVFLRVAYCLGFRAGREDAKLDIWRGEK